MNFVDVEIHDWSIEFVKNKNFWERKRLNFEDLVSEFKNGNLVIFPLDWNTLKQTGRNRYAGHFVIISGIEDSKISNS